MSKKKQSSDLASNRQVYHNFEVLETFETGISLMGTEVKSLRANSASLQESYVKIINQELWLLGAHIPPYSHGNINNHQEQRDRKLLMHKKEISKLRSTVIEKGMTLVALKLYLTRGIVKVKIGLAKGKKLHDKRADQAKKDVEKKLRQGRYE